MHILKKLHTCSIQTYSIQKHSVAIHSLYSNCNILKHVSSVLCAEALRGLRFVSHKDEMLLGV